MVAAVPLGSAQPELACKVGLGGLVFLAALLCMDREARGLALRLGRKPATVGP